MIDRVQKFNANFAIFAALAFVAFDAQAQEQVAPGVFLLGKMANTNINESSGLIPSHRLAAAFWTHNDGDDGIFGITRDGRSLGRWSLRGVETIDFEDIAWSPGRLYIGDIGNNDLLRSNLVVYAVPEPGPQFSGSVPLKGIWRLRYPPGRRFDFESLLIHRRYGYLITREIEDGLATVFRFPLRPRGGFVDLEEQCKLEVAGKVGAADMTRDGKRLAILTRERGAHLFELPGTLPSEGRLAASLFVPFESDFMEGACFTRDGLLATSETGEIYLFDAEPFRLR